VHHNHIYCNQEAGKKWYFLHGMDPTQRRPKYLDIHRLNPQREGETRKEGGREGERERERKRERGPYIPLMSR
jgi:hypothetical protein